MKLIYTVTMLGCILIGIIIGINIGEKICLEKEFDIKYNVESSYDPITRHRITKEERELVSSKRLVNLCEDYANQNHTKIRMNGAQKEVMINNVWVNETDLITSCLSKVE